jgi:hypothetical protein
VASAVSGAAEDAFCTEVAGVVGDSVIGADRADVAADGAGVSATGAGVRATGAGVGVGVAGVLVGGTAVRGGGAAVRAGGVGAMRGDTFADTVTAGRDAEAAAGVDCGVFPATSRGDAADMGAA